MICVYMGFPQTCANINITNNLAAGGTYAGFAVPGHDCGAHDTQVNFKDNVAHSIQGVQGGYGAIIYPDKMINPSHETTCFAGSHFAAYKCAEQGAYTFMKTRKVIFSNMTMIDNVHGFGANLVASFA